MGLSSNTRLTPYVPTVLLVISLLLGARGVGVVAPFVVVVVVVAGVAGANVLSADLTGDDDCPKRMESSVYL